MADAAPAPVGALAGAKANRTDLTPPKPDHSPAFSGMPYGQNQQLNQMARNIPNPGQPSAPIGRPAGPAAPAGGPAAGPAAALAGALAGGGAGPGSPGEFGPAPGSAGDFLRPTERPNEPITAGLSSGPGPGPEALQSVRQQAQLGSTLLDQIRALYQQFPTQALAEILSTPQVYQVSQLGKGKTPGGPVR